MRIIFLQDGNNIMCGGKQKKFIDSHKMAHEHYFDQ